MNSEDYWEDKVNNAEDPEDFKAALNGMMSHMVDEGHISMSWCDEKEDFIFFMTEDQKRIHDMTHPG